MNKSRKLIVIISVCVTLIFLVTVAVLSQNTDIGTSSVADESVASESEAAAVSEDESKLIGTWVYDDGTEYRFAQDGTGGMTVGSYEYKFTYDTSDSSLKILYDNSEVHDSEYTYSFDGEKLKLIGGEGTAGGEYYLEKAD